MVVVVTFFVVKAGVVVSTVVVVGAAGVVVTTVPLGSHTVTDRTVGRLDPENKRLLVQSTKPSVNVAADQKVSKT